MYQDVFSVIAPTQYCKYTLHTATGHTSLKKPEREPQEHLHPYIMLFNMLPL